MGGIKKEYSYLPNSDKTVLGMVVSVFADIPGISTIVITVPPVQAAAQATLAAEAAKVAAAALPSGLLEKSLPKILFTAGGTSRRSSVHNALSLLAEYKPRYVLIHDGSRPWVSQELIQRVMESVQYCDAVIPAEQLTGTPKEIELPPGSTFADGIKPVKVMRHLCRSNIVIAQTPQAFAFPQILSAHEKAAEKERQGLYEYTDDAEVWGEFCGAVTVIPGEAANRKITYPQDLGGIE